MRNSSGKENNFLEINFLGYFDCVYYDIWLWHYLDKWKNHDIYFWNFKISCFIYGRYKWYMPWCFECMFMVCYMMLIFFFIFDDYMMERQGKNIIDYWNQGCIIEGDPTYLVIILFINYPYHLFTCPIY